MFLENDKILDLFKSYPDNISFPRDNEYLHKTVDILFIANLLLNWKDEYKLLGLYIDIDRKKQYAFTNDCYHYFDNNTGEELNLRCGKNFIAFRQWIKKSTVKKYIQRFFYFRNILRNSKHNQNISVNGIDIVKRDILLKDNLENLNDSLKYKLYTEINLNLLQTQDRKSSTDLICPFCGEVKPIIAHFGYPYWTINIESFTFISEYDYVLCPKCLGLFHSYPVYRDEGLNEFMEEMHSGDVSKWLIEHPSYEEMMKKYEEI